MIIKSCCEAAKVVFSMSSRPPWTTAWTRMAQAAVKDAAREASRTRTVRVKCYALKLGRMEVRRCLRTVLPMKPVAPVRRMRKGFFFEEEDILSVGKR